MAAPLEYISEENNVMESMMVIADSRNNNSTTNRCQIEIVIAPGIKVITQGAGNLGGPVLAKNNNSLASGDGVIR
jgi:hypothetical protein